MVERLSVADQLGLVAELDAAIASAPEKVVARALLRALVASHGPAWLERQCVSKFYVDGVPGCSLCAEYGEPVEVVSRPRLPGVVFHLHGDPDPRCAACPDSRWPCRPFEAVRAAVVW